MKNSANPSLSTTIPPIVVPWPFVYFEVEWTTTSTPHLIGLNKAAVATVLSQIVKTPCFFACVNSDLTRSLDEIYSIEN